MGRLSRYKRYKHVDPFCKDNQVGSSSSGAIKKKSKINDLPPKEIDFDQKRGLRSTLPSIARNAGKKTKKNGLKKNLEHSKSKFAMRPGESKKHFLNRLDQDIEDALKKAMMDTRAISAKRKNHLRARDRRKKEAKKKQKEKGEGEITFVQDTPKFGEVVQEPPRVLTLPRKGTKKDKVDGLKLAGMLQEEATSLSTVSRKRKNMTEEEKCHFDAERENAIKNYRLLKKQMVSKRLTPQLE